MSLRDSLSNLDGVAVNADRLIAISEHGSRYEV